MRAFVGKKKAAALALCLAVCAPSFVAAAPPSDPTDDWTVVSAGFLEQHLDIKYRLLGLDAYKRKRYDDALRLFRRAAFLADKPSQGMIAEMYWKGEGAPRDPVQAYIWMDLAAERGYVGYLALRETYWKRLSETQRESAVEDGQAVYARFGDDVAKPRHAFKLRVLSREITGSRVGANRGVEVHIPGVTGWDGSIPVLGTSLYDPRYWQPEKYWAWQDADWKAPQIGTVTLGEIEGVEPRAEDRRPEDRGPRSPKTAPPVDAPASDAPAPNTPLPEVGSPASIRG